MIEVYQPKYKEQVIALIDEIYREHGDSICLENADSDLENIEKNYFETGGCFWIYKVDGRVVGSVAVRPEPSQLLLKRLYLNVAFRGSGVANQLLKKVTDWAKDNNYRRIYFWSDTRFKRSHRFYLNKGFQKGRIREMNDGNMPYTEYYFEKMLD
jgi:putative acetyltransferase